MGENRRDDAHYTLQRHYPGRFPNTEKERFRHIYEAGAKEQMAVAERAAYYPARER